MRFPRVLVLAAHPDDEMGCAGTIFDLIAEGSRVAIMTASYCEDLNPRAIRNEWLTACSRLGIGEKMVLDLPNRRLPEHRQQILETLDVYRGRYDLVLAPATSDAHQDHATIMAEAMRAFKHTTLLGYELPMNTVRESTWSAYMPLSEGAMQAKVEHARIYQTQSGEAYMEPSFIRSLAAVRGLQAGVQYAEAFEVVRWVM